MSDVGAVGLRWIWLSQRQDRCTTWDWLPSLLFTSSRIHFHNLSFQLEPGRNAVILRQAWEFGKPCSWSRRLLCHGWGSAFCAHVPGHRGCGESCSYTVRVQSSGPHPVSALFLSIPHVRSLFFFRVSMGRLGRFQDSRERCQPPSAQLPSSLGAGDVSLSQVWDREGTQLWRGVLTSFAGPAMKYRGGPVAVCRGTSLGTLRHLGTRENSENHNFVSTVMGYNSESSASPLLYLTCFSAGLLSSEKNQSDLHL